MLSRRAAFQNKKLSEPRGRKYIVYFDMHSDLEGNFAVIYSDNKDNALYAAIEAFGASVARVEIDSDYQQARIKFLGLSIKIK